MLGKGVCVKREGVTQEILDIMVCVAKGSGFSLKGQSEYTVKDYDSVYIGCPEFPTLQNIITPDKSVKEITLEDWLFALAPKDSDRIVKYKRGGYKYCKKGSRDLCTIGNKEYTSKPTLCAWSEYEVVYSRSLKKEQYSPKVGEDCLHGGTLCTPLIIEPDVDNMVVVEIKGEYVVVTNNSFSKLPEYTEQELLAYELYCEINGNFHTLEDIKPYTYFDKYLKVAESGRFK